MIEVKVDTATPRSPSSSTNCGKGSTMIGQRTRPHPLDGPAKRGLPEPCENRFPYRPWPL